MLPFLEKEEIFTFCHIFPALFQNQLTWKALVHSWLPFYSKPDPADRQYKRFLRQRQLIRLNWYTQQSSNHVFKRHSIDQNTRLGDIATDSSNIAILRTRRTKPDSFIDIYGMDCKFVKTSKMFKELRHLQANNGKALAIGDQKIVLLSLKTAELLTFMIAVDDAVFLDDSSIVSAGKEGICQINLGKPESYSILSRFQEYFDVNKLCKTTVRNRVLGHLYGRIIVWDTRQSVFCHTIEMKNTDPMLYDACAGGENSFFAWDDHAISEYDIRFHGVCKLRRCLSEVQSVYWTPDFLYAYTYDEGMRRFDLPADVPGDFMPDIFGAWKRNKFDITDRYCVGASLSGSHSLKLTSVGFQ